MRNILMKVKCTGAALVALFAIIVVSIGIWLLPAFTVFLTAFFTTKKKAVFPD